ncbi:MAG TPA: DUF2231 domain-containing protein [Longimicrobiales bacterium]
MRSKAHFRGDPIHPAIVHFPIAFLLGGTAMDVVDVFCPCPDWWPAVSWALLIGGVVTALAAAVPGFVDYIYTVPPASSAKRRATRHMLLNLAAVALFAGVWFLRGDPGIRPEPVLVAAEGLGAVLILFSGAMGGKLMAKNHIGVDTKYAYNRRWSETTVARSGDVVASAGELAVDQMKLVRIAGKRVVLGRTESGFVAFDDHCTHRGGSLAGGIMICGTVQCPWHGSQFNVATGAVKCGPAGKAIGVYRVEETGGEVRLFLD